MSKPILTHVTGPRKGGLHVDYAKDIPTLPRKVIDSIDEAYGATGVTYKAPQRTEPLDR